MTTTQPLESLKTTLEVSANKIERGLNGRVLLGTLAVLAALFAVGFIPRWRGHHRHGVLHMFFKDERILN